MGTGFPSPAWRWTQRIAAAVLVVLSASVTVAAVRLSPHAAHPVAAKVQLPDPRPTPHPSVAPLGRLVQADVLITSTRSLAPAAVAAANRLPGVQQATTFAYGTTQLLGSPVTTFGVDPSSFRDWAVATTAKSDPLWAAVANGELTTSFDAAKELNLPLGETVALAGRRTLPLRLGAFDTVGLPGADAVVSADRAASLGLPAEAGLLLSAPAANLRTLTDSLRKSFGTAATVSPLRELPPLPVPTKAPPSAFTAAVSAPGGVPTAAAPATVSSSVPLPAPAAGSRLAALLTAAKSRIGLPYVYGAAGPSAFDCSGFTQWAFQQIAISLPRSAAEQWVAGPHLSYAAAQPGDVLAWAGDPTAPGYVTHVALYLGDGMMISAAHTGTTIAITPVYTDGLLGAVRFL
jgi:cell wall-associated NlpC family hydrolase